MTSLPKIILITGATGALGQAVSLAYASPETHLILLGRKKRVLERLDDQIREKGGQATLLVQDLTDKNRLAQLGPALFEKFGRLDGTVFCHGALGELSPHAFTQSANWQYVMDVNLNSYHILIQTLHPLHQVSENPFMIFTIDSVAHSPKPFWGAYGASQAALFHFAKSYQAEMKASNLSVYIEEPKPFASYLRGKAFPGEDQKNLANAHDCADRFLKLS